MTTITLIEVDLGGGDCETCGPHWDALEVSRDGARWEVRVNIGCYGGGTETFDDLDGACAYLKEQWGHLFSLQETGGNTTLAQVLDELHTAVIEEHHFEFLDGALVLNLGHVNDMWAFRATLNGEYRDAISGTTEYDYLKDHLARALDLDGITGEEIQNVLDVIN